MDELGGAFFADPQSADPGDPVKAPGEDSDGGDGRGRERARAGLAVDEPVQGRVG